MGDLVSLSLFAANPVQRLMVVSSVDIRDPFVHPLAAAVMVELC